MAAFLAVFCACFKRYRLAPGERGVVMCLASDRRQARVIFRYVSGLIASDPMLEAMVESRTKEAIHLRNGISGRPDGATNGYWRIITHLMTRRFVCNGACNGVE